MRNWQYVPQNWILPLDGFLKTARRRRQTFPVTEYIVRGLTMGAVK